VIFQFLVIVVFSSDGGLRGVYMHIIFVFIHDTVMTTSMIEMMTM